MAPIRGSPPEGHITGGAAMVEAGFSGSSATDYIGALYTCRLANGTMLDQPRLFQPATIAYSGGRWGDYSATTLDPTDDWSFWTVQAYARPWGPAPVGRWATVIGRIRPMP